MRIDIDDCRVLERRCFFVLTAIGRAAAKSLVEGQAVLGRHDIVKHRVHCAGEVVETSYNILTNLYDSWCLKEVMKYVLPLYTTSNMKRTVLYFQFARISPCWHLGVRKHSHCQTNYLPNKRFRWSNKRKLCYKTFLSIIFFKVRFQIYKAVLVSNILVSTSRSTWKLWKIYR